MEANIKLEKSWHKVLKTEFDKDYMHNLTRFLIERSESGAKIYPEDDLIFNAFNLTPLDKVKVVIIGQDPYHGAGQAHGLSFSVREGTALPPSLKNIYKEIKNDLGLEMGNNGSLIHWAQQGVLLLNSVLTVEHKRPGSHQKKGWEQFTDKVIEIVNQQVKHCVFILWGSPAQKKAAKVDGKKHLILKSPHPSPLSAHRGFWNQHHFGQANVFLANHNRTPIQWAPKLH